MDPYVDPFQELGASMVMIAKGNRSKMVRDACQKHEVFIWALSVDWQSFLQKTTLNI